MIDTHQHFWKLSRGDYPWPNTSVAPIYKDFLPFDLAPLLEENGVEKTILVQATPTVEETEFLLDLAEKTDFVAGVVGWVDLAAPEAKDTIDRLRGNPFFKGVRPMLQDISNTAWVLQPQVLDVLSHVAEAGLTMDALVQPRHLPAIHQLLLEQPDLKVVIDHIAKPDIAAGPADNWWLNGMEKLANCPNCYCKLSGMVTEAGPYWTPEQLRTYVEHIIDLFGPERTMWGSDWPVVNLASDYTSWIGVFEEILTGLEGRISRKTLSKTAEHFYDLVSH